MQTRRIAATGRAAAHLAGTFALALLASAPVRAADFDAERMAPESDWTVIVSPYIWAASLKGDASIIAKTVGVVFRCTGY